MVVEEENELEGVAVSTVSFDKLSDQERHLVRHRELFLSRQIETYKIDMVRYGKCVTFCREFVVTEKLITGANVQLLY